MSCSPCSPWVSNESVAVPCRAAICSTRWDRTPANRLEIDGLVGHGEMLPVLARVRDRIRWCEGDMNPKHSPEILGLTSMMLGWSSADVSLKEFSSIVVDPMAFLEEYVFFHHYIALEAAFHVFPDLDDRRDYCDKMVQAVDRTRGLPNTEEFGLPPVEFYQESDIKEALRGCFASFANLRAVFAQSLYLERKQTEGEYQIMNDYGIRKMTDWESPAANSVQYFTAALLARLALSQKMKPDDHRLEFLKLSFSAVAEAKASFRHYMLLLGATEDKDGRLVVTVPEIKETKRSWFSRAGRKDATT